MRNISLCEGKDAITGEKLSRWLVIEFDDALLNTDVEKEETTKEEPTAEEVLNDVKNKSLDRLYLIRQ